MNNRPLAGVFGPAFVDKHPVVVRDPVIRWPFGTNPPEQLPQNFAISRNIVVWYQTRKGLEKKNDDLQEMCKVVHAHLIHDTPERVDVRTSADPNIRAVFLEGIDLRSGVSNRSAHRRGGIGCTFKLCKNDR